MPTSSPTRSKSKAFASPSTPVAAQAAQPELARRKDVAADRPYQTSQTRANTLRLLRQVTAKDRDHDERQAEAVAHAVLDPAQNLPAFSASRRTNPARGSAHFNAAAITPAMLPSVGKPIHPTARAFLERRFGQDFQQVRVHDDPAAHGLAGVLEARAFTFGWQVVFAAGEYAPATPSGMQLLAHELTHVMQHANDAVAVLRCAPVLSKHSTGELIDEDIAGDVDKALAGSDTIKTYVPEKDLKKSKGHLHIQFKESFDKDLAANEKKLGGTKKNSDPNIVVKGFTDLATGEIHLKERLANLEGAIHETIHLNSKVSSRPGISAFQNDFGNPLEEGVTQHFTNMVLHEQTLSDGKAYPRELAMAESLISLVGEKVVGDAYFSGKDDLSKAITAAFSRSHLSYTNWRTLSHTQDPDKWAESTKLLRQAFGKS